MKKEEYLAAWKKVRSRGELKRLAKEIDKNSEQRRLLEESLRRQGADIEEEWPAKKLLRLFLDRSAESQVRKNPIHRNEGFICVHCQADIIKSRGKIRDHCPLCLRGVHLDIIPGDRASKCHGKLVPIAFTLDHGSVRIQYRCMRCTHQYQVDAHPDDQVPLSLSIKDLP